MRKRYRRWLRRRLVRQVVRNGIKTRKLYALRASVSDVFWPEYCAELDQEIEARERRHVALLDRLRLADDTA